MIASLSYELPVTAVTKGRKNQGDSCIIFFPQQTAHDYGVSFVCF